VSDHATNSHIAAPNTSAQKTFGPKKGKQARESSKIPNLRKALLAKNAFVTSASYEKKLHLHREALAANANKY
jgi:hypothetical protein